MLVGVIFLLVIIVLKNEYDHHSGHGSWHQDEQEGEFKRSKKRCKELIYCKDVLKVAVKGKWMKKTNTTSPWKEDRIEVIRNRLNLPETMSREDMRCGLSHFLPNTRLASLCDANSDLSCCSETSGWCGNTDEHCSAAGSVNTKINIKTSQAVWKTDDSSCKVNMFSSERACAMLSNHVKKLVFLGDSQARHFFTTLMLFLSGNYKNGAIKKKKKSNKYVMANCTHQYQLLNKNCRSYIVKSSRNVENLCNGEYNNIDIEYFPDFQSFLGRNTRKMLKSLHKVKKSYVVLGAGTHMNSDYDSFGRYYLQSLPNGRMSGDEEAGQKWPQLIIETLHNVYSYKSNEKRWEFNEGLAMFIRSNRHIQLFDNSLLTTHLESPDGRTYGLKFNILKVQILLHYFYNKNPKCL